MSLPSLGVIGARPLLESPVELAGLFLLPPGKGPLNGLSGTAVVGVVIFLIGGICADNGTPVIIVKLRCRTCAEEDFIVRWSIVDVWLLLLGKLRRFPMLAVDLCCDDPGGGAEIDSPILAPKVIEDEGDDVAIRVELLCRV